MKKNLRLLAGAALGAAVSLGFTSCYYDPAYGSTSVGASYSTGGNYSNGYGAGYGYGGSGFSTSLFVSTGNSQWGYDPYCHSYYDYRRRCYYDPYLNGYYPVGYRPAVVYGVPHPHGWRAGGGYIRPPVYVQNVTVRNYQNRAVAYQGTNYGWAKQVRQQPATQGRVIGNKQQQTNNSSAGNRQNNVTRTSGNSYNSKNQGSGGSQATRQSTGNATREQPGTLPSRYNSPVKMSDKQQAQKGQAASRQQAQRTQGTRPPSEKARGQNGQGNGKGKKAQTEEEKRAARYR